jgi:hypothetical protein
MKKLRLLAYFIALSGLLAACSLVENEEDCDPFGVDYEGEKKQPDVSINLRYEREPNNWQPMIGYVYREDSVWLYDENFRRIQETKSPKAEEAPFYTHSFGSGVMIFSFPEKNTPTGKDVTTTYYLRLAYNDIDTLRFEYKLNKGCKELFNYANAFYNNELVKSIENRRMPSLSIVK